LHLHVDVAFLDVFLCERDRGESNISVAPFHFFLSIEVVRFSSAIAPSSHSMFILFASSGCKILIFLQLKMIFS
jgi:hypothetical protein